jgi:hypothetical protein
MNYLINQLFVIKSSKFLLNKLIFRDLIKWLFQRVFQNVDIRVVSIELAGVEIHIVPELEISQARLTIK